MTDVFNVPSFEELLNIYKQLGGEGSYGVRIEGYSCIPAIVEILEVNVNSKTSQEIKDALEAAKEDLSHMTIERVVDPDEPVVKKESKVKPIETSIPVSVFGKKKETHPDTVPEEIKPERPEFETQRIIDREVARRMEEKRVKDELEFEKKIEDRLMVERAAAAIENMNNDLMEDEHEHSVESAKNKHKQSFVDRAAVIRRKYPNDTFNGLPQRKAVPVEEEIEEEDLNFKQLCKKHKKKIIIGSTVVVTAVGLGIFAKKMLND